MSTTPHHDYSHTNGKRTHSKKQSAKTQSWSESLKLSNDGLAVQLGVTQYVNVCVGSDLLGKSQHHVEVSVTLQGQVLLEGISIHSRSVSHASSAESQDPDYLLARVGLAVEII